MDCTGKVSNFHASGGSACSNLFQFTIERGIGDQVSFRIVSDAPPGIEAAMSQAVISAYFSGQALRVYSGGTEEGSGIWLAGFVEAGTRPEGFRSSCEPA